MASSDEINVRLNMGRYLLLIFLGIQSVVFAAGRAQVFFPANAAGGKLGWLSSGVRLYKGDVWEDFDTGKVRLPLTWTDAKNRLRYAGGEWAFDLPDGRFLISAEKSEDRIVFTLTRVGGNQPLLRSAPFNIETMQELPLRGENQANHSPEPAPSAVH